MQPIFKELIEAWKSMGVDIQLIEGFYWLDKQIVKAFDSAGNIHFLYKITVNDDLTISCKKHSKCPDLQQFKPESWEKTVLRIKPDFHIWFSSFHFLSHTKISISVL